jgi:hypothetical protein
MKSRLVAFLVAAFLIATPGVVAAQEADDDDEDEGVLIVVNDPLQIAAEQRVDVAVGVNNDVTIDGTVTEALLVIRGDAVISGTVEGDVAVFNGTLTLLSGSQVEDVQLYRSDLTREDGATVTGEIDKSSGFDYRRAVAFFSIVWGIAVTIALLIAGLVFAAIGGRQLSDAATLLTSQVPYSIVAALVVWIGLPILATLALVTIIGIPLGMALFLLLVLLWVLGYLVAATRVGAALTRLTGREGLTDHPYLAVVVGVVILQLIGIIPFIGGLIVGLAGLYGAGGLVLRAWQALKSGGPPVVAPPAQPAPAA